MKEQVLGASDRAALQSLIPLAGALGAGTIFGLFFGARKRVGFAMFELFTMAAILTAVGTTAYFCIALLHQDRPISDRELAETATPLLVAAFLLVFVNVFSRLPGSASRVLTLLPLGIGGAVLAAALASSAWTTKPEDASLIAIAILLVGGVLGLAGWWAERAQLDRSRSARLRRLARLAGRGYESRCEPLALALPWPDGEQAPPQVDCWRRQGRAFLDPDSCERLGELADERWRALGAGAAHAATGSAVLARLRLGPAPPWSREARALRVSALAGGERRERELTANDDGLYDVTELGLLEA